MTTSSFTVERRYRRRRRLALFLTAIVVLGVIALAVRFRNERRETADYFTVVDEIAQEELAAADSLNALLDNLSDFGRPEIIDRIVGLTETAAGLETSMDAVVVSRPVAKPHGFASVAVASWRSGLEELDDAVINIMDQPDDVLDLGAITAAFDRLRLGDAAYAEFLVAVELVDADVDPPQYADIQFVPDVSAKFIADLASRLRLSRILDERRDISVTANTSPEPAGEQNGFPVVPFVDDFSVTAVVTNMGNVIHEEIEIVITLLQDGVDAQPLIEVRLIPSLEPGASISEEFAGLPLQTGALYTVTVVAEVQDDADFDNNRWELLFATNPN